MINCRRLRRPFAHQVAVTPHKYIKNEHRHLLFQKFCLSDFSYLDKVPKNPNDTQSRKQCILQILKVDSKTVLKLLSPESNWYCLRRVITWYKQNKNHVKTNQVSYLKFIVLIIAGLFVRREDRLDLVSFFRSKNKYF